MKEYIQQMMETSLQIKQDMAKDESLIVLLEEVAKQMITVFQHGGKVLLAGNGGSAADAQHIAAELSGRFRRDRQPLFAEALHVNSSFLTAVSNDYGYEEAFARMVEGMGRPGDLLIAISTSGNSPNILRAVERAHVGEIIVVGLTGQSGGALREEADFWVPVPSNDTPRIQEAHILIGHILCELVEQALFGEA
ncbi:MAG: D-sedoheptulose 7-phosphate isomerase [Bacteroidota bacterium]